MKGHLFYGWWIAAAGAILAASGFLGDEMISSRLPTLLRDGLGSSAVTVGGTLRLYSLSGIVALLASGPLIDRFGPRKVMLVGISMAGIGFVLSGFVRSIVAMNVVLGLLLGAGLKAGC